MNTPTPTLTFSQLDCLGVREGDLQRFALTAGVLGAADDTITLDDTLVGRLPAESLTLLFRAIHGADRSGPVLAAAKQVLTGPAPDWDAVRAVRMKSRAQEAEDQAAVQQRAPAADIAERLARAWASMSRHEATLVFTYADSWD